MSHQILFLPQHRVVGPPFSYTTTQDEYKMKSFISTFENVALGKRILRDGLLSEISRYQNLVAAYHKAYLPTGTKQSRLIAAQNEWNRVKRGGVMQN